jgi:hypothetical protein
MAIIINYLFCTLGFWPSLLWDEHTHTHTHTHSHTHSALQCCQWPSAPSIWRGLLRLDARASFFSREAIKDSADSPPPSHHPIIGKVSWEMLFNWRGSSGLAFVLACLFSLPWQKLDIVSVVFIFIKYTITQIYNWQQVEGSISCIIQAASAVEVQSWVYYNECKPQLMSGQYFSPPLVLIELLNLLPKVSSIIIFKR